MQRTELLLPSAWIHVRIGRNSGRPIGAAAFSTSSYNNVRLCSEHSCAVLIRTAVGLNTGVRAHAGRSLEQTPTKAHSKHREYIYTPTALVRSPNRDAAIKHPTHLRNYRHVMARVEATYRLFGTKDTFGFPQ